MLTCETSTIHSAILLSVSRWRISETQLASRVSPLATFQTAKVRVSSRNLTESHHRSNRLARLWMLRAHFWSRLRFNQRSTMLKLSMQPVSITCSSQHLSGLKASSKLYTGPALLQCWKMRNRLPSECSPSTQSPLESD